MNDLLLRVRNNALVDRLYRGLRDVTLGPGWGGFHRDRVYRALMLELVQTLPFTSFVETGTYRGYSCELIAHRRPGLAVFTVEAVESTYRRAQRALRKYPNVTALRGSSDEVLRRLIAENKLGEMPLFYLDAHWQEYWPLRDELRAVAAAGQKAVIVIDDFEVPGQSQFGFDIDGGGERTAGHACNLDYIRPSLDARHAYRALFPRYGLADAFPSAAGQLRGHIVLFQNMAEEYEAFLHRPLVRQHYFAHAALEPAVNEGATG